MHRIILVCLLLLTGSLGLAQVSPGRPARENEDILSDTTIDYDELLNDLDDFLDFLMKPRSYLLVNLSAASAPFNYVNKLGTKITREKQLVLTPTIGYYHRSGAGLSLASNIVNESGGFNAYQFAVTPSYDYIANRKFITGISYTHYFTRDSLDFYATPLNNELNAYFTWRQSWIQPGIAANVGWGSRTEVRQSTKKRDLLRLRRFGILSTTHTEQSTNDFTLTGSIRHSFYWLNLANTKGYLKFTPLITLSVGTQRYGFNSSGYYSMNTPAGNNVSYKTGEINLDDKAAFRPQSMTVHLRPEYVLGKFFLQPQIVMDYYLRSTDDNFTFLYALNLGVML